MNSTPPTKRERERKIRQIAREYEDRKRALGLQAPVLKRGPIFYLVVVLALALVGGAVLTAADGSARRANRVDAKVYRAQKSVAALAEALGRFKFHCGTYPSEAEGLEALALKASPYRGWVGPYASTILPDPWKRAYLYEPSLKGVPVVLSLGPDGVRGTADDIAPDASLFTKPFRDTTWTNDWVPYRQRGIIVVPRKSKK